MGCLILANIAKTQNSLLLYSIPNDIVDAKAVYIKVWVTIENRNIVTVSK
jgi:hypothetical protein